MQADDTFLFDVNARNQLKVIVAVYSKPAIYLFYLILIFSIKYVTLEIWPMFLCNVIELIPSYK